MSNVFALLGLAALLFMIWSFFGVFFAKGRRKRKLGHLVIGFLVLMVAAVALGISSDREARQAGFQSVSDQRAAKSAGIDDPTLWAAERESVSAQKRLEEQKAADALAAQEQQKRATQAAVVAEKERQAAEDKAAAERQKQEAAAAKDAACREDLKCWGEKASVAANIYCPDYIERMAKYDFEWTDGFLEPKFSHYRWKERSLGIVTMLGDKVKFQNGFGAWTHMTYECDIDPASERIIDVRVHQGRL